MGEEVSGVNNTFGGVYVVPSLVLIMLAGTDPDEVGASLINHQLFVVNDSSARQTVRRQKVTYPIC